MRCEDISELLSGYIDGVLDDDERGWVESHLAHCHRCASELEALRSTLALVQQLEEVEPPVDFRVNLRRRIVAEQRKTRPGLAARMRRALVVSPYRGVVAAAATLALALGTGFAMQNPDVVDWLGLSKPVSPAVVGQVSPNQTGKTDRDGRSPIITGTAGDLGTSGEQTGGSTDAAQSGSNAGAGKTAGETAGETGTSVPSDAASGNQRTTNNGSQGGDDVSIAALPGDKTGGDSVSGLGGGDTSGTQDTSGTGEGQFSIAAAGTPDTSGTPPTGTSGDSVKPNGSSTTQSGTGTTRTTTAAELQTPPPTRVGKSALVGLEVRNVDDAVLKLGELAEKKYGDSAGFVEESTTSFDENGLKRAMVRIKVPADSFQDVLTQIGKMGVLKSQSVTGHDVTLDYADMESRLKVYKQQESRYLEIQARAKTIDEMVRIENELSVVRTNIEVLEGRLAVLKDSTAYSVITVDLSQTPPVVTPPPTGSGTLTQVGDQAGRSFLLTTRGLGVLAVRAAGILGGAAPVLIIVGLGWLGYFIYARFRPQRARGRG